MLYIQLFKIMLFKLLADQNDQNGKNDIVKLETLQLRIALSK